MAKAKKAVKKTVKKVVRKAKAKVVPLLEQPYEVRELVFIQKLEEIMKETGVILSLATRDSKDLGASTAPAPANTESTEAK